MSFRGGSFRGGSAPRGGRGGFGGRPSGGFDQGPPEQVIQVGAFLHPCESELVCKSTQDKIPHFNAPIYLENKSKIGKFIMKHVFSALLSLIFSFLFHSFSFR
jgi:H/ACA ribonucleoprotein complex subunit 1